MVSVEESFDGLREGRRYDIYWVGLDLRIVVSGLMPIVRIVKFRVVTITGKQLVMVADFDDLSLS